jgi:hypothetical protein
MLGGTGFPWGKNGLDGAHEAPTVGRHGCRRRAGATLLIALAASVIALSPSAFAKPNKWGAFHQQAKLAASDETGTSELGAAVALSQDGNTALIGGPGDNEGKGAAWIFIRTGSTWTEQAKLTGISEFGEGQFGTSVALSSDGNTALIGGPKDNGGLGAAWVFTRSGATWVQQGEKLAGQDLGGEQETHCEINRLRAETYCFLGHPADFGASVALSSAGKTALIGGPGDNENNGAVWVFTRSRETWIQQGEKLTGEGEQNFNDRCFPDRPNCHIGGRFGASLALSSNENTAVTGGPRDDTSVFEGGLRPEGAIWVFTRSGSVWNQQGDKLTGTGGSNFEGRALGESVALSANGNTTLAGAPFADWAEEPEGAAWAFTRSGATWAQQGERLKNREPVEGGWDEELGVSLALSSHGNTALIANRRDEFSLGASALVFDRSRSTWTQTEKLPCGKENCHVALSGDGSTALFGTAVFVSRQHRR